MSLPVEPLPPNLHLTPCAVTSSLGRDQPSFLKAGKEPGRGGEVEGGGGRRPQEEPFPLYRVFQNILFMNRLT